MSNKLTVTVNQWLIKNGYDPAQAGLSVEIVGLWMPPELWDTVEVDAMAMLTVRRE